MILANKNEKTRMMVVMAFISAIIIMLEFLVGAVTFGASPPFTLSLVPIILGAVLYGPIQGAILGAIFGLVVVLKIVFGLDLVSLPMFDFLPITTTIMCLVKGSLAGFMAGLVAKLLKKYGNYVSSVAAAVVAPICNTAVYSLGVFAFYGELIKDAAISEGFTSNFAYIILVLCGLNFIFELSMCILFSPVVSTVIKATKRFFK